MVTVIAALIAGLIAATGWFISSYLTGAREDRTNRLRLTLDHSERQISEFYPPILGLLTRLNANLYGTGTVSTRQITDLNKLHDFIQVQYFVPINEEIASLMRITIHLLEGNKIPGIIVTYLRQFASENIAQRLDKEIDQGVDLFYHVVSFPNEIQDDIQDHLKLIRERQETTIQELRNNPVFLGPTLASTKARVAEFLSKHTPSQGQLGGIRSVCLKPRVSIRPIHLVQCSTRLCPAQRCDFKHLAELERQASDFRNSPADLGAQEQQTAGVATVPIWTGMSPIG